MRPRQPDACLYNLHCILRACIKTHSSCSKHTCKYASPERIYLLNRLTWLVACQIPFELHCVIARKRGFLAVLHRARLNPQTAPLPSQLFSSSCFFTLAINFSLHPTPVQSANTPLYSIHRHHRHVWPAAALLPAYVTNHLISSFTPPSLITDSRHRSSSRRRRRTRSVQEAIATNDTLPMLT